jgi:membrane protease subunit (stomatin/prohibitin family)
MGLFSFFKGEFVEVIDWHEQEANTILWKFPDKENDIKYGAGLTVRESQTALFINEGRLADVFEPGRYELQTSNMPILTKFKNWDKAFNSPFKVDVYFLSTKTFGGLKWGTPNPIILRDPEFKQVRVKAFGTYFIKIKDPFKFFTEFSGATSVIKIDDIEEKLRDLIVPKFAEALAEAQVSVLDMVANYSEIGDKIKPLLQGDLELFGIDLVRFQVTSTSMPPEVEAFYDKMTNINMVDNMTKYAQFQSLEAMGKAAENSNSIAGIGAGLGAGMNLSHMMLQNVTQSQQAPPQAPPQSKDEIMETLKKLGDLKTAGILTDEEFNAKKKELLAKL